MSAFRDRLSVVGAWLRDNSWVILIVVVVLLNLVLVYDNFFSPPAAQPKTSQATPSGPQVPSGMAASPLDGEYVPEATTHLRPFAIMIDNLVEARPDAGLSKASVVWEALAEGGVTRIMPVFQTMDDVVIGPVRSARDYFLPWAEEVGAIYAHSGGSIAGLQALANNPDVPNADEFSNGSSFYREPNIAAPHNLFTSISRLTSLATNRGWQKDVLPTPWTVSDTAPTGTPATNIKVDFSSLSYRVQWHYDQDSGLYQRTIAGAISVDRNTNAQLTAKNVVVLFAPVDAAPDTAIAGAPAIAVEVHNVGSGDAWFFRDGVMTKGTWKKDSVTSRTVFQNTDGTPYAIARGPVWIEVMDQTKQASVTVQ